MPKKGNKGISSVFDSQLAFICRDSLRVDMVAIAFLRGDNGAYASVARYLLERAAEEFIRELTVEDRRKFDQIRANVVKLDYTSKSMKREGRTSKALIRGTRIDEDALRADPGRLRKDAPD